MSNLYNYSLTTLYFSQCFYASASLCLESQRVQTHVCVCVCVCVCLGWYIRQCVSLALAVLLAYLSIPVIQNLFSSRQLMNTSFDSLRIVNTYGAFGRSATRVVLT